MISLKKLIAIGALGFLTSFSGGCATMFNIRKAEHYKINKEDRLLVSNPQKRDLFKLAELVNVDLSNKKIKVDVGNADIALMDNQDKVFKMVEDFYKDLGVELEFNFVVPPIKSTSFDYTKNISLEFANAPPFRKNPKWLGYAQTWNGKSYIWLSKCRAYYGSLNHKKANRLISAIIVHELGHLFGLTHTHTFANDSLEDYLTKGMPNCMSYKPKVKDKSNPIGCWVKDLQKRRIHSYLSKGKIYQALEEVGFDHNRYNSLVGLVNGYYYLPRK